MSDLDLFCERLLIEPKLLLQLRSAETLDALFAAVLVAAQERGLTLALDELEHVARANQRAWLERGLL